MTQVWKGGPSDRSQRLLLLALADSADDEGFCWPGTALLAGKVSMSVRTVLRALKSLENDGWIRINRKAHHRKGNTYEINLDKLGDKKSHDKLSRDKTGMSQVTKRAESGDKTGNPPHPLIGRTIKNHQEPSLLVEDGFTLDGSPKAKASVRFTADEIEMIYRDYPKKVKKQKALEAIKKALKAIDDPDPVRYLLASVREFADSPAGKKGNFTPHPASWFNDKQWLDDRSQWQGQGEDKSGSKRAPRSAKPSEANYDTWGVPDEGAVQQ
jgi:Helix-turn-helix domain